MRLNELIIAVARHTGWTLEYIGQLPLKRFMAIYSMLEHQQGVECYRLEYRFGQIICTLVNSKQHKYKPEQFVGDAPKPLEVTETMTTIKKHTVALGDGKVYTLARLNINMMEEIEEEFNQSWQKLMEDPRAKVAKALVHVMLKPNYPELTREQVGELLTTKALIAVQKIIIGQG